MKTKCLVYSRVVGYIRPVENWNVGKVAEYKDRNTYDFGASEPGQTKLRLK